MILSKAFDCSTDSLCQYHRKSMKNIMEIVHTDVRLYGVNLLLTLFHQSPLSYVISFNQNGGRIHQNLWKLFKIYHSTQIPRQALLPFKVLQIFRMSYYMYVSTRKLSDRKYIIFIFITLIGDQRSPWPQVYPFTSSVLRDQNFNFSCQVPGNGVSITWLKNGEKVPNHQTQLQSRKTLRGLPLNENILMLKTVSWVDAANYTCVVTTSQQPGYSSNITRELFVKGTVKSALIIIYFLWGPDQLHQLCSGSDVDHSFPEKNIWYHGCWAYHGCWTYCSWGVWVCL